VSRVFGRGELKAAVLDALDAVEPANGYTIMQTLADQVGGGWRPSPGAIYPALLGLEDAGLIVSEDDEGSRRYRLSPQGRQAQASAGGTLERVAERARRAPAPAPTVGALVDAFATAAPARSRPLDPTTALAVSAVLDGARTRLTAVLDKENPDG